MQQIDEAEKKLMHFSCIGTCVTWYTHGAEPNTPLNSTRIALSGRDESPECGRNVSDVSEMC